MDHKGGYKLSAYRPALGAEILRRMAAGQTIKQIAADPAMPSYPTVFRWRQMVPEFAEAYDTVRLALARRAQVEDVVRRRAELAAREAQIAAGTRRRRPAGSGRRSTYDKAVAIEVCRRVAGGAALSAVAGQPGMPSLKAIYTWLKRFPEFEALYLIALDERAFWSREEVFHRACTTHWAAGGGWVGEIRERRGRLTPKKYRPGGRVAPKGIEWKGEIDGLVFGDQSWRWPRGRRLNGVLDEED